MALTCYVAAALFVLRQLTARRPLVNLRGLGALSHSADLARSDPAGAQPRRASCSRSRPPTPRCRSSRPPVLGCWPAARSSPALFWWRQRRAAGAADPAGRARAPQRLGCAAGQLLRRLVTDRSPRRHPGLRPDHRLPRLAARRGTRPRPAPGRAARRRRRRRLAAVTGPRGRACRDRDGAGGRRASSGWRNGTARRWSPGCRRSRWSCAGSASASRSRRSTRRCSPGPAPRCTASRRPCSWSRGWSGCWSGSRP